MWGINCLTGDRFAAEPARILVVVLAPLKHTVSLPPNGKVRVEFLADNPGRWFFHCHNLYHMETGMAREWLYTV